MMRRLLRRILLRSAASAEFAARGWSNRELEKFGYMFDGRVLNVSGGADADKEGRRYREYFPAARGYEVSNYGGLVGLEGEFSFDLETTALPEDLANSYDVVFSHTVLEHVYDLAAAIRNICAMSNDIVITVVPFLQSYHHGRWYDDFWRFTPRALIRLFADQGLTTLYTSWNEDALGNLYVFHICSKQPSRWTKIAERQDARSLGPGVKRDELVFGAVNFENAVIDLGGKAR